MRLSIYKIINKLNKKYYVGSSKNVIRRWNNHKLLLKKKIHHNDYLQNAWNKYGEATFDFVVVKELDINTSELDLLTEEQKWLNIAKNDPLSYNLTFVANNPNMLLSDYSKIKRSESLKKVIRTQEWKDKISKSHVGLKQSTSTIQKIIRSKLGKKQSKEHVNNAAETRKKYWTFISPANNIINIYDLKNFCRNNNLHSGNMYWVARGKKYQYKGWKKYPLIEKKKYIQTEEHIRNMAYNRAKDYTLISPTGNIINIHNLSEFCEKNNLEKTGMWRVVAGKIKHYKGWRK